MSATRDLIAAALTAAGSIRWQYPELADDMRELCARAMVEPDIGEVKNLVSAACNLMFDAGKLLGRRDAGADREVEDARSARTALLDYVRGVMAERDALLADNERLSGLYEQAVKGRADMRSALRDARAAAPRPVGEFCTDYHCPGDCGLEGAGYQHARQPVSTTEVAMPQGYAERPSDYTGGIWIESQMRTYGDTREAAEYARGVAACLDALADACCAAEIPDSKYESMMIALRGEVKP